MRPSPVVEIDETHDRRRRMEAKKHEVERELANTLKPNFERWECKIDGSGDGIRVGISSWRSPEVFETLHQTVLRGFEPHDFRDENGMKSARFGYLSL